jgi:GTP cyclohydrolase II
MLSNKRYILSSAISGLRNGFCVCLIKNARKTFFFCKNTIHPEILQEINDCKVVTTKEYFNYYYSGDASGIQNENVVLSQTLLQSGERWFSFEQNADDVDNFAIQLAKIAELQPILIATQNEIEGLPYQTIDIDNIDFDVKTFQYEISFIAKAKIQLAKAQNAEIYAFCSKFGGHEHYAILINDPLKDKNPLVRIHSSCYTGDLLASLRCDCRDQLQESIAFMNNSSGILLYVMQEGRGIGLANKIKAYNLQQENGLDTVESNFAVGFEDEERSFVPAVKMLHFFQKKDIKLITNNPKKADDISKLGITVAETVPTYFNPNQFNAEYLQVKKDKMGHTL